MVDAVKKGLWGAVEHFLAVDPQCMKKTNKYGAGAWGFKDAVACAPFDHSRIAPHAAKGSRSDPCASAEATPPCIWQRGMVATPLWSCF